VDSKIDLNEQIKISERVKDANDEERKEEQHYGSEE